jgi:threonine synthase
LIKRAQQSKVPHDKPIVCVLTGHGLKDPRAMTFGIKLPAPVAPTPAALRKVLARLT